jgi:glycosyltransferase involved in cell wall biosynthesis
VLDGAGGCLRVLYLTRAYTAHDGRFLSALARTMPEVHYLPLCSKGSEQAAGDLPDDIVIEPALWQGKDPTWARFPGLARRLRRRLESMQPDLVHAGPVHLGATIAALVGFHPLVSMSWGSDLLWEARKPVTRLAARYTLSRSDVLVGDCRAVQQAAENLGMDPGRVILFPWGVDLKHFSPGSADVIRENLNWQEAFILLSTRQFEPLYGVEQIVDFFIQQAPSKPSLRLLMLGSGSQKPAFEDRLEAAGLSDRVHFAGLVDRFALPAYYRTADLYLSGSFSDGSSVSLLEAMACALPVLVSDIAGNREWVDPGRNGWLFEAGSVSALSREFEHIFAARGRLRAAGLAARSTAEARADWSANFPRLLEAYDLAVQHAHGGVS